MVTSSTPSKLTLKPNGRKFTLTLKGTGLDRITDVQAWQPIVLDAPYRLEMTGPGNN